MSINKNKRVILVASVASMIDQFNRNNIQLLKELGYEIHVACNFEVGNNTSDEKVQSFRRELEKQGICCYQLPIPRKIYDIYGIMKSYFQLKKIVGGNFYTMVHCHTPIGGAVARMACKKSRKSGTKVIYTAHGFHFYKGAPIINWCMFYPVEIWCSKYTDAILTMNEEDYKMARNNMFAKNVYKIHGIGLDTQKFASKSGNRETILREMKIPPDSSILLSVGEVNKNKNHITIIKALKHLERDNTYYLICGKGQAGIEKLSEAAKEMGVSEKVRFMGFCENVSDFYSLADVFIFPSQREGLSVALMEAMSKGLPIVASDIRGNHDLIQDGVNGILVETMNEEGYKNAIQKLLNDNELRASMARKNIERIKEYDKNQVIEETRKIYCEVTEK